MEISIYLILALSFSFALTIDQDDTKEAADLQREIQEYLQALAELHPHRNRAPGSTRPQVPFPRFHDDQDYIPSTVDEDPPPPVKLRYPFHNLDDIALRSFASATIKRPKDGKTSEAIAFSSIKEVDDEEHLGEEPINAFEPFSTTTEENSKTPPSKATLFSSVELLGSKSGPTTLKHQQTGPIIKEDNTFSDVYFVAIVAGCCAAGIFGIISAGFCFYRLQKHSKAAAEVDYPAYGVTGPSKDAPSPNGDRKLAQSAQMYHYQHQKQQMIAVEKAGSTKNTSASDVDSEEENEEGEYTVYECPGLAPTEEMEVKNPLFHDDSTPVSPPMLPTKSENNHHN